MYNIPKKIFVGYDPASGELLPLGKMCPIGPSSGERSKVKAINNTKPVTGEYNNIPMPGFTVSGICRSVDSSWTIIDPRGFTAIITNDNLMRLMKSSILSDGLITDECVWVRNDSSVVMELISTNDLNYQKFVTNTDEIENRTRTAEIAIGNSIRLQNNISGVYYGIVDFVYSVVTTARDGSLTSPIQRRKHIVKLDNGNYFYAADLSILEVVDDGTMTDAEAMSDMVLSMGTGAVWSSRPHSAMHRTSSHEKLRSITRRRMTITHELREIDIQAAATRVDAFNTDHDLSTVVFKDSAGMLYSLTYSHSGQYSSQLRLRRVEFVDGILRVVPEQWKRSNSQIYKNILDFTHYYEVVKVVNGGETQFV